MKTTVEIADALLTEAKRVSREEGLTLRELIERGLRDELASRGKRGGFRLRDATADGRGLRPELREGGWAALREAVYGDRGG